MWSRLLDVVDQHDVKFIWVSYLRNIINIYFIYIYLCIRIYIFYCEEMLDAIDIFWRGIDKSYLVY